MARTSSFPGFGERTLRERRTLVGDSTGVAVDDVRAALDRGGIDADTADKFVENVLGTYALPFGVALNVSLNGQDRVVPMVVEDPGLLVACSDAAKWIRRGGGFRAEVDPPLMISQVQLVGVEDTEAAARLLRAHEPELLERADRAVPGLVARGGGARSMEVRVLGQPADRMLAVHLLIDCRDAMGANLVNTVAEAVADRLAAIASASVGLRILSNLCDRRCVRVRASVPAAAFAAGRGSDVLGGIANASRFAELDPYGATALNEATMSGVDAVVMATGNDWRAVESGAHAFAARSGRYMPLAVWRRDGARLVGSLEMPLALGTVGGTLRVHPAARLALRILGTESAGELAMAAASVGLASSLAALAALVTAESPRAEAAPGARRSGEEWSRAPRLGAGRAP